MGIKKAFSLVIVFLNLLILSVSFTNCAKGPVQSTTDEGSQKVEGLTAVNYFREAVPAKFCGEEGYGYLLRSYIGPQCGSCHSMGGSMFPPFGDSDLSKAYSYGRTLSKAKLLETVQNNRFCGPDCNLDTRGEVYQALAQWLDHTDNCN